MQQRYGLQGCLRATLTRTTPSHAEADERDTLLSKAVGPSGRVILPWLDQEKGNPLRIPVVDTRGVALMPCTPAKARHLFKSGKSRPKRNKLGLFYVQLIYEQEPDNQPLVVGIDPGSHFEGYSVVGAKQTVLNLMAEAPDHVKDAVPTRRPMRPARRSRKWPRPTPSANDRTPNQTPPPPPQHRRTT